MASGAVLILAALSLLLLNRREARQAEAAVEAVLPQVIAQMPEEAFLPVPHSGEMATVEVEGEDYIGCLSIPALGLELPVMADWSYPRLKTAPCRYAGSTKTDDFVIMAHNYDRHFGRLSQLSEGDEVLFTDMEGVVTRYAVAALDILDPTAIGEMTAGDYDLTLFTCTYGGKSRVTLRCDWSE